MSESYIEQSRGIFRPAGGPGVISMLLPLLLFFSSGAQALPKDPERDLSVKFSTKREGKDAGSVVGSVRNNSTNAYPCVRIEFDLMTRFDLRPPGEKGRHLGVLSVEVQNLQPHGERDYQQPLPFPAGIGVKSVSECLGKPSEELPSKEPPAKELPDLPEILSFTVVPQRIQAGKKATLKWRAAQADHVFVGTRNPEWPQSSTKPIRVPRGVESSGSLQVNPSQTTTYRLEAKNEGKSTIKDVTVEVTKSPVPAATCSIKGRITGRLQWDTKDDRGQPVSFTLTYIYMAKPGATQPVRARVRGREYIFENVPAGKTYRIFPGSFRSQPREKAVSCRPNAIHQGVDFEIIGAPSSS